MTFLIDELVQSTTMSGLADLSVFAVSLETLTLSRAERPATSPRSRPTFAGSTSPPATTLNTWKPDAPLEEGRADRAQAKMHHAHVRHELNYSPADRATSSVRQPPL